MITGRCLCGTVRYRIEEPFTPVTHCHCTMCRKAHGAAFASYTDCAPEALHWTAGEEAVVRYASSPAAARAFCRHCGSVVPSPFSDNIAIPAGNLEGDPDLAVACHIFTADKAPWHVIADDLPRHENWEPDSERPVVERRSPQAAAAGVVRGSCLCGAVAFEVTEPFQRAHNCYCSRCRLARSAAHASNAFTSLSGVLFMRGEDHVSTFKLPQARHFGVAFCNTCGSGVPRLDSSRDVAVIPMGALDDDPGRSIDAEIYTGSAARWYPAAGELPRFEGPPG